MAVCELDRVRVSGVGGVAVRNEHSWDAGVVVTNRAVLEEWVRMADVHGTCQPLA